MLDYFYSFSIDIEEGGITIEVDDCSFTMVFLGAKNKEPEILKDEEKFSVEYKNIYNSIDLEYILDKYVIKENIILRKDHPDLLNFKLILNNCTLKEDKKDKSFKILKNDHTEIFKFSQPNIIYQDHNKDKELNHGVFFSIDNDIISYSFNKDIFKGSYPVIVDPTFVFNTSLSNSYSLIKTQLNSFDEAFITGSSIKQYYYDSNDVKNFTSDDVIFEGTMSVLFPFFAGLIDSVKITLVDSLDQREVINYNKVQINDDEEYSYVDIPLSYVNSATLSVFIEVFFTPNSYGGYSRSFLRRVSYVKDLNIFFKSGNFLYGDVFKLILVESLGSFKPLKYHILPFYMTPTNGFNDFDDTKTFIEKAKRVENFNSGAMSAYFDIYPDTFPIVSTSSKTSNGGDYSYISGSADSFVNKFGVVLESAINNRTNIEQGVYFHKKYKYLNESDFLFGVENQYGSTKNGKIFLKKDFFPVQLYQKSLFYIEIKNNKNIFETPEIYLEYNLENDIRKIHTSINFLQNIFYQKFESSTTYPVTMSDGSIEQWKFSEIGDNNIFRGTYLFTESDDGINSYRIIGSTPKKIIIEGNHKVSLKYVKKMGIFAYNPDIVKFIPESQNYKQTTYNLKKFGFTSSGDIRYKDFNWKIQLSNPTKILVNIRDSNQSFGGISKIISINSNDEFIFLGSGGNSLITNAYIDIGASDINSINHNNDIKLLFLSGATYNKLTIPFGFEKKILVANFLSPEPAENIITTVYFKNGTSSTYQNNVSSVYKSSKVGSDNLEFNVVLKLEDNYSYISFDYNAL